MLKLECVSFFVVLFSLSLKKHSLSLLLSLELLTLLIVYVSVKAGLEVFLCFLFLCVGACEGAIGLSALVSLYRGKTCVA